jgi:sRNA-binding regulator protein Hfq
VEKSATTRLIPGQPIYKRSKPAPEIPGTAPRPPILANHPSQPATPDPVAQSKPSGQSAPAKVIGREQAYLLKHSSARTPMVVVLRSGTVLRGRLAWVDKYSIKIERQPAEPNVLVFKASIDCMHRETRPA